MFKHFSALTAGMLLACTANVRVKTVGAKAAPEGQAAPEGAAPAAVTSQSLEVRAAASAAEASPVVEPTHDTVVINSILNSRADPASQGILYLLASPAQSLPRLGDRFYVSSVLTQVFGPSALPLVSSLIGNNPDTMGGPCDRYAHAGTFDCQVSLRFTQAPVNPVSTSARAAFVTRACEGITAVQGAVQFAATQVSAQDVTKVPPTALEVDKLYGLFAPYRAPTTAEHAALLTLSQSAMGLTGSTPVDAWRYVLLSLCLAPRWQLL